jgi:NAD+ diphosphatase
VFESIPFAGNAIDRLDALRHDAAALAALHANPATRYLPFRELKPWIALEPAPHLGWVAAAALDDAADTGPEPLLLGRLDGAARFALALTDDATPAADGKFIDARSIAPSLAAMESGQRAPGRTLIDWHASHRHCARCGSPTIVARGGAQRDCPACGAHHFPRNDPVVIMLVTRGDACLLGRQHHFAEAFWSCLAGFVEPGETLEAAVRREVREEAGVETGVVRYLGSQPWPFPASLMLGCHAEATSEALAIDDRELADLRWFDRAEVATMLANCDADAGPRLPRPVAIAHHLVRHWLGWRT